MLERVKEDYVKEQSTILRRQRRSIDKLKKELESGNLRNNLHKRSEIALNKLCAQRSMTEERIGLALGFLGFDDLRPSYRPVPDLLLEGVAEEMKLIRFI